MDNLRKHMQNKSIIKKGELEMGKEFEVPNMEVIKLSTEDIITKSGGIDTPEEEI